MFIISAMRSIATKQEPATYNQLEVAIDSDWTFEITQKDDAMKMRVMEYLKRLLAVQ